MVNQFINQEWMREGGYTYVVVRNGKLSNFLGTESMGGGLTTSQWMSMGIMLLHVFIQPTSMNCGVDSV